MEIRQLTADDWEIYKSIRLDSLINEPQAFQSRYEDEVLYTEDRWRKKTTPQTNPLSALFCTIFNQEALGVLGLYQDRDGKDPEVANLYAVYVRPEHRGKGLSKKLLALAIETVSKDKQIQRIDLCVEKGQVAAKGLYDSMGFSVTGETPGHKQYIMTLDVS